jgi:hypothetical protein
MKLMQYSFLLLVTLVFAGSCKKESTSPSQNNNTATNDKVGTYKGPFTYTDSETDTVLNDYEFEITKTGDNKYNALSADETIEFEVTDNNGTLNIPDLSQYGFTTFSGTLSNNTFKFDITGDDDGNEFEVGFVGTKKNTGTTPSNEYFIFDNNTYNGRPELTTCEDQPGSYPTYYFGIYNDAGGSVLIRLKSKPGAGTYNVVSYQKRIDENIGADECVVSVSETISSPSYFSTGTSGKLYVTLENGKLVHRIENVKVALNEGMPEKLISAAKGYCK